MPSPEREVDEVEDVAGVLEAGFVDVDLLGLDLGRLWRDYPTHGFAMDGPPILLSLWGCTWSVLALRHPGLRSETWGTRFCWRGEAVGIAVSGGVREVFEGGVGEDGLADGFAFGEEDG